MTNSPDLPKRNSQKWRRLSLLVGTMLVVGVGLPLVLVFALRSPATKSTPNALPTAAATALPASNAEMGGSANQDVADSSRSASQVDESTAVALVNGQVLELDAARRIQSIDQAIAGLLGQPVPDDALDRLINGELVRQAAAAAGFILDAQAGEDTYTSFLAGQGIESTELADAVAEHGLSLVDFRAYFDRLILLDRFSRAQAAKQGITQAQYIEQLQQAAQISFGPEAALLAESAQSDPGKSDDVPPAEATPAMSVAEDTAVLDDLLIPTATAPVQDEIDSDSAIRGISTGLLAPDFALPALNSSDLGTLTHADLIGQPAVLSFWTTWCPYCRRQTPILVEAHDNYAEQGIRFVGINVKEGEAPVAAYLDEHNIAYPIALDIDGDTAARYNIRGFPTTYFLDAEGRIVAQQVGALTADRLDYFIQTLMIED